MSAGAPIDRHHAPRFHRADLGGEMVEVPCRSRRTLLIFLRHLM